MNIFKNVCGLFSALVILPLAGCTGVEADIALRQQVERAVASVYPALVQIHVVSAGFSGGREQKRQGSGSGVIISKDGMVVTNHHVAGHARRLRVIMSDRTEVNATLVGTDPLADIAVLKMDLSDIKGELPVAEWGDSDKLLVGDTVLAMGSPRALSQSVTQGIVANAGMTIPGGPMVMDGENVGSLVKWIGHDAAIYPGNSGGPLVDLNGRIVGINEIGVGLSGAIPSNIARQVADQLMAYGHVKRSWVGIGVQPLLKRSGLKEGVLVSDIAPGSPAEKAGLKTGDIITHWNGKSIQVRFGVQVPDFNREVLFTPVGTKMEIRLLRDGKPATHTLTTILRHPVQGEEQELKDWGITARSITPAVARNLQRDNQLGVLVASVRTGGQVQESKPGIRRGDIIVKMGRTKIKNLHHLIRITNNLLKNKKRSVPVLVAFEHRKQKKLTLVKLGPQEKSNKPRLPKKPWFPASYQVLTRDLAGALGLKGKRGVRITRIYENTTAAKSELKTGDVLTHLDGSVIDARELTDLEVLHQMIREYKVGAEVEFTVRRAPDYSKTQKISVILPKRPQPSSHLKTWSDTLFDLTVRNISNVDRLGRNWPEDKKGALVTEVTAGNWAALAGVRTGDLISRINGVPISGTDDLKAKMKAIRKNQPRYVVLFVERGVYTRFVEIEPLWKKSEKSDHAGTVSKKK